MPDLVDLTHDRIACAILRALARQPWQPAHLAALIDRMKELGYDEQAERLDDHCKACDWSNDWRKGAREYPRRQTRRALRRMRQELVALFGDFEKYSSVMGGDADTPSGSTERRITES